MPLPHRTRRCLGAASAFVLAWLCVAPTASADMLRGIGSILAGLLELPRATLAGTVGGPPVLGTIVGALSGAVNSLRLVAGGGVELAASAIPLAKLAAPWLIFM